MLFEFCGTFIVGSNFSIERIENLRLQAQARCIKVDTNRAIKRLPKLLNKIIATREGRYTNPGEVRDHSATRK